MKFLQFRSKIQVNQFKIINWGIACLHLPVDLEITMALRNHSEFEFQSLQSNFTLKFKFLHPRTQFENESWPPITWIRPYIQTLGINSQNEKFYKPCPIVSTCYQRTASTKLVQRKDSITSVHRVPKWNFRSATRAKRRASLSIPLPLQISHIATF